MYRQDVDHASALLVNHSASELNVIIIVSSLNVRMRTLERHVGKTEQLHVECTYRAAHLNRRMACLGIHAADMGYADHEIYIAHDLRIHNVRNFRYLFLLAGLSVIERDKLKRRTLCIRRREPVCKSINRCGNVLPEENFLETFIIIGYPSASLKCRNGLLRLDLISREKSRIRCVLFFLQFRIELSEDLLEGLLYALLCLFHKEQPLEACKLAKPVQCDGMRDI